MKRRKVLIVAVVAVLLVAGCGRQEQAATATVAVPRPTATVQPNVEPEPTATTAPTSTLQPTATIEPTTTPEPTPTSEPTKVSLSEEIEEKLESIVLQNLEIYHLPGFALGVVTNGKLAYAKAFGVLNIETKEPVETNSLFQVGQLSQIFVATAIMQLVERGEIELDAPVVQYLPDFILADERYLDITLRHLLNYTSGIPVPADLGWEEPEYDDGALARFVRSMGSTRLVAEPGKTRGGYGSSTGEARGAGAFDVLGQVIAQVSGESFEDYMRKRVLDPLRMRDSTFLKSEVSSTLAAAPHVLHRGELVVSEVYPYNRAHAPSIGLQSNVLDMCNFALALLNEGRFGRARILEPTSIEAIAEPQVSSAISLPDLSRSGLGCYVGEYRKNKIISGLDGSAGFLSALALLPDKSMAVVLLANGGSPGEVFYAHDSLTEILGVLSRME